MEILFPDLPRELREGMQTLLKKIDETFPLSQKYRSGLPRDVAELSRQFTSGRGDRVDGYLGKAAHHSAYLRYFLPWNVFRLLRLLPSLQISLRDGDAVCDLGSGPMTFALALWIARPDLRKLHMEIRCVDRTAHILEAGKKLFYVLAGEQSPWKIRIIKGSLGTPVYGEPAALVTAVNVYNELFWDDRNALGKIVKTEGAYLRSLTGKNGSILVAEPGIPRSGEFISVLRETFLPSADILAPCPHKERCPFPGGKRGAKWCHFAFDTDDAPAGLHSLSRTAGIPKERAVLSFLYVNLNPDKIYSPDKPLKARVISDPIMLGGAGQKIAGPAFSAPFGRYACSSRGMILVSGKKDLIETIPSGALLEIDADIKPGTDPKTGIPVFGLV